MELTRLSTEPIYKVAVFIRKTVLNCKADVVCRLQMPLGFYAPIGREASKIEMCMDCFDAECNSLNFEILFLTVLLKIKIQEITDI